MAKVVHLSSVHRTFDTRIFHKELRSLAEAGYEVVFVNPYERDETINGIRIHALPKPRSRTDRLLNTIRQVYGAAVKEDADLYHFHDPELIPVGWLLRLRGKRVIYDVHEDFPRQISRWPALPKWLRIPIAFGVDVAERVSGAVFSGFVIANPLQTARFPARKTVVVENYAMADELVPLEPSPYDQRPALIAYVGSIKVIQGVREIIQAMAYLPPELGARLVVAGKFNPVGLEDEVRQLPGAEYSELVGVLTREEVRDLLARSRVGLVLYHPVENYLTCQPNKVFEYMSAGIPLVASNIPSWRQFVEAHECGIMADPLDPQAIAEAIQWMLEHPEEARAMGEKGRAVVEARYNWDTEAQKLLARYQTVLAQD